MIYHSKIMYNLLLFYLWAGRFIPKYGIEAKGSISVPTDSLSDRVSPVYNFLKGRIWIQSGPSLVTFFLCSFHLPSVLNSFAFLSILIWIQFIIRSEIFSLIFYAHYAPDNISYMWEYIGITYFFYLGSMCAFI